MQSRFIRRVVGYLQPQEDGVSRFFPRQGEREVVIKPEAVAVALPLTLRERLRLSWSFLAGAVMAPGAATRTDAAASRSETCDVDKDLTVMGCYGPHIF